MVFRALLESSAAELDWRFAGGAVSFGTASRVTYSSATGGGKVENLISQHRSDKKCTPKLTALTRQDLMPVTSEEIGENVNRSLSEWLNYVHYRNSNLALEKVKIHADREIRRRLNGCYQAKEIPTRKVLLASLELCT